MEADEKKCPRCAETVKAEAEVCKHCGYDFETGESPGVHVGAVPPKEKSGGFGKGALGCMVVLVLLLIIVVAVVPDAEQGAEPGAIAADQVQEPADESEDRMTNSLTGPQKNAARSAQQYLAISGFSREGLIDQLSSDAGEGYDVADATAAVHSLNVDWNEQAVRSARQYLQISGFSCKGLIEQVSSSAGEKYTVSQATYGANQAGAC